MLPRLHSAELSIDEQKESGGEGGGRGGGGGLGFGVGLKVL